jgi:hypothetical protein
MVYDMPGKRLFDSGAGLRNKAVQKSTMTP